MGRKIRRKQVEDAAPESYALASVFFGTSPRLMNHWLTDCRDSKHDENRTERNTQRKMRRR